MNAEQSEALVAPEDKEGDQPLLYHYTSNQGALGIIESGTFWASELAYLNDSQELLYGYNFAAKVAEEESHKTLAFVLSQVAESATQVMGVTPRLFATCFCLDGDLLSQWRGYGASSGYALGLNLSSSLRSGRIDRSTFLASVQYNLEEQRNTLANRIERIASGPFKELRSAYDAAIHEMRDDQETADRLAAETSNFVREHLGELHALCALNKNPAFSEEREVRLLRPSNVASKDIKFRIGLLGLTPYVVVDLRNEHGLLPIERIVVSPGAHDDLRVQSMKMLLVRQGYDLGAIEISPSTAPYRVG